MDIPGDALLTGSLRTSGAIFTNILECARELSPFKAAGTTGLHVSFDLDVCDPLIAPGVGTPVKGGLDYCEAHMLMEMLAESGLLRALDLVEVNPILDDCNMIAVPGVELVGSG